MSDKTEVLGIVLRADGVVELTNGLVLSANAFENTGKKADGAGKAMAGNTEQMARSGKTAKETAAAWRLLPAQITDVVTSLASGQPAWLVAIQQGGQVKDSFGGIGPMFRELSSVMTLGRVAALGAAAGAGALALAYIQGQREAGGYTRSIVMTGNAAGTTRTELAGMAEQVSRVVGTQGKAAEALAAINGTGEVARANLRDFAATAVQMERELDVALTDTAANFEQLGRAPLEASLKLNRGLNYLTAATYDHIRALQAEGKFAQAGAVAQQAYAAAMDQRTSKLRDDLGWIARGWRATADAAKGAWDAFADIGRPSVVEKKLADAREGISGLQRLLNLMQGGAAAQAAWVAGQNAVETKGAEDAEAVARRKQELRDRERANIDAGLAVDLARASSSAAQRQALAERDLAVARASGSSREALLRAQAATLEDLRSRDNVSLADYYERRAALERAGLAVEIANVDAEISAARKQAAARAAQIDAQMAAESRRQPETPAETAQQQGRLIELGGQRLAIETQTETRVTELRAQRGRLTAQQIEAEVEAQRSLTNASAAATDRWLDDVDRRRQALAQLNDQQRQANAAAAVDLIADPYTRAAAKARLDLEELNRFYTEQLASLRARLPALDTADPSQAAAVREQILVAEQQKNDAIVLRTRQLTEELKPEWQRQLEGWRDHTRLMRESFDDFQSGWLDSGRAAWAEYMRTGRLSLNTLGQYIRQQFGDVIFKQVLAEPFSKVGQGIAGLFGLSGADGADVAGKVAAQAGEATARTLNTTAISANSVAMGNLAVTANYAAAALAAVAASSGGNSTAGLLGQIIGAVVSGGSAFGTVDGGGIGMTPGDGSIALPTRGGLAGGGNARAGGLYPVNEQGPELLTVNNRTYLMMGGRDGYVTPNTASAGSGGGGRPGGGGGVVFSPVIHIDSRTDRAEVAQLVQKGMRSAQAELLDAMARRMA